MYCNNSKKMFTEMAKSIRTIGVPDNQRPDDWSSTVRLYSLLYYAEIRLVRTIRNTNVVILFCVSQFIRLITSSFLMHYAFGIMCLSIRLSDP
jgi:hypothetical protein